MNEYNFLYKSFIANKGSVHNFSYHVSMMDKTYRMKYGRLSAISDARYIDGPEPAKKAGSGLFFSNEYLSWFTTKERMNDKMKRTGEFANVRHSIERDQAENTIIEKIPKSIKQNNSFLISRQNRKPLQIDNYGVFAGDSPEDFSWSTSLLDTIKYEDKITNLIEFNEVTKYYSGSTSIYELIFNNMDKGGSNIFDSYIAKVYAIKGNVFEPLAAIPEKDFSNIYQTLLVSSKGGKIGISSNLFEQVNTTSSMSDIVNQFENIHIIKDKAGTELGTSTTIWKVPYKTSPGPEVLTPHKAGTGTEIGEVINPHKFFPKWHIYDVITAAPPDAVRNILWRGIQIINTARPVPGIFTNEEILKDQSVYKIPYLTYIFKNYNINKVIAQSFITELDGALKPYNQGTINEILMSPPTIKTIYSNETINSFKFDPQVYMDFNDNSAFKYNNKALLLTEEHISNAYRHMLKGMFSFGDIIHKLPHVIYNDNHEWLSKYGSNNLLMNVVEPFVKPNNNTSPYMFEAISSYGKHAFMSATDFGNKDSNHGFTVYENLNASKDRLIASEYIHAYITGNNKYGYIYSQSHASMTSRYVSIYSYQILDFPKGNYIAFTGESYIELSKHYEQISFVNNAVLSRDKYYANIDYSILNTSKSHHVAIDNAIYFDSAYRTMPLDLVAFKYDAFSLSNYFITENTIDSLKRHNITANVYDVVGEIIKDHSIGNADTYMLFGKRHLYYAFYDLSQNLNNISLTGFTTNELAKFDFGKVPDRVGMYFPGSDIISKHYKYSIENITTALLRTNPKGYIHPDAMLFIQSPGVYGKDTFEISSESLYKRYKDIIDTNIGSWFKTSYKSIYEPTNVFLHKFYLNINTNDVYNSFLYKDIQNISVNIGESYAQTLFKPVMFIPKFQFATKDPWRMYEAQIKDSALFASKDNSSMILYNTDSIIFKSSLDIERFHQEWISQYSKHIALHLGFTDIDKKTKDLAAIFAGEYISTVYKSLSTFNTEDVYASKFNKNVADDIMQNIFANKYNMFVSTYNRKIESVSKFIKHLMYDDYFTSASKDNLNVYAQEENTFTDKAMIGLYLRFYDTSAYKGYKPLMSDSYSAFLYNAAKDTSDALHNTDFTSKDGANVMTTIQEWVFKGGHGVFEKHIGVHTYSAPKPVMLTDEQIIGVTKDLIDARTWDLIQRYDFIGVSSGGKDLHVEDNNAFALKDSARMRIDFDTFASIIPKEMCLMDMFSMFCDKDRHSMLLNAENVWADKGKMRTIFSRIGEWIDDGKRSIITFSDEMVIKPSKSIPSVFSGEFTNKDGSATRLHDDIWINDYKKSTILFNLPEQTKSRIGITLFESDETIYKIPYSTYRFDNEFINKLSTNITCESQEFFSKQISGFTTSGDFMKRMNVFKARTTSSFEQIDKNISASVLIFEKEGDGFDEKLLIPVSKLQKGQLYSELDSTIKKYKELGINEDDFGSWAWVYEYPENPFDQFDDLKGIDELLLPENDTKYEKFEDILFNKKLNRPRNPVKQINDNTWVCKFPSKHPFKNFYETEGNHYVGVVDGNYFGVDVGIMQKIFLKYYQIWQQNIFRFATMSMLEASKTMLEYLYSWITLYFPVEDLEQALRVFRQVRWFSESAVINNSQYIISGEWEDMKILDIENDLEDNHSMYYDPQTVTIRNANWTVGTDSAYVTFYIDAWKNTTFSFSLINTVGNVKVYIDDVLVDTISKTKRGNIYPIKYTGETTIIRIEKDAVSNLNNMFFIGDIRVAGLKFGGLDVQFDPKLKAGNKPLSIVVDKMTRFANLYDDASEAYENALKANVGVSVTVDMLVKYLELHHNNKVKGKRLTIKKT